MRSKIETPIVNDVNGPLKDVHHVSTKWCGKMHFESKVNDHIILFDKLEKHGGNDNGPRPKPLMLSAIAGCIGMEVIGILQKMRIEPEIFEIKVDGELSHDHPKVYKKINIVYLVKTGNMDQMRTEKAINLAIDKYCGVIAMVRSFAEITNTVQFI